MGLNSYRTQQVVDFENLGADGLFGIFGPTGSGKSSILDAITLALYGGVDRASNNTRGIIHQLERILEVSFEFQLGEDRYLVERRYDRNPKDPDAAVAKQARLRMFTSAGENVLASKPQEVTANVEEILGIGKDEFSQAVVLPQGKFDQFLRLTGGDRAVMLEHLFNLEQYGEGLVAKVKNEAAILTELTQRVEGEEQGLGDCSQEAIKQAVLDLKSKNDEYLDAQKVYEKVEKSYKETENICELFLKRKTAVDKISHLKLKQNAIDEKQSRLSAAECVEPLRELLSRQKELNKRILEENILYEKSIENHSNAVVKDEIANKELEIVEQEYRDQLPLLQEKKAQYQGAREKQSKLQDLKKNIDVKKRELDEIEKRITCNATEIANDKSRLDDIGIALESLLEERTKLIVNPKEKESLERALSILLRLEECEKRYEESKKNYTKRKLQNDGRWADIVDKAFKMQPEQVITAGDDLEKLSKSLLTMVEKDLEKVQNAHHHALIVNSAAELVKELHDGEACPVCGSREHPLPAKPTDEINKLKAEVIVVENRLREVREWESQLFKAWHEWSNNESLDKESRELMESAEKDLQVLSVEFEEVRGGFDRNQLRQRKQELTDFERRLHEIEQKLETMRQTEKEAHEKLQKLNDSFQKDKINSASVQAAWGSLKTQFKEIAEEVDQTTGGKDLDDLIQEMVQSYQKLQKAVDDCKRQEEEIRVVVAKFTKEIAALEATLRTNRKELGEVEKRLAVGIKEAGFTEVSQAEAALLSPLERQGIRRELDEFVKASAIVRDELDKLDREIDGRELDEVGFEQLKKERQELMEIFERFKEGVTLGKNKVEELLEKQERWNKLQKQKTVAIKRKSLAEDLMSLLRGRRFVSFLAQEHLRDMTLEASYQLGRLTGQRYALELAKDKDCEFVIRDDYNGGNRRAINSLSGGEVFMTSLALALALSSKIQLRGKYPLGFFFLDEGFGSLDEEKLDKVMNALEKLHDRNRMVGVISHVRELKERLPRYLEVVAAGEDGNGSRIRG